MLSKGASRTDAEEKVAELLLIARESLGLTLTFLSRFDGPVQHLEVVESSIPFFKDGTTQPRDTSLCQTIIDNGLPCSIPNTTRVPALRRLPAVTRIPRLRSLVSVPVELSDGTLYGTFCAAGLTPKRRMPARDEALMRVLAKAAASIVEPDFRERNRLDQIRARLLPMMEAGGPTIALQPIVSLDDGRRVGAEALSRFPVEWSKRPDEIFEEAAAIGAGLELELMAFSSAAAVLGDVSGYVAVNFSPATILTPRCRDLLLQLPLDRIVLELSEHDPVSDYAELANALQPLRERGMRLAIDDVGAGYSSLRHIVLTSPDVVKLDRSIVAGVGSEPVLRTLVRSLTDFAHEAGAVVVAEGIEAAADAVALAEEHVDCGQGWLFGRAGRLEDLEPVYSFALADAS